MAALGVGRERHDSAQCSVVNRARCLRSFPLQFLEPNTLLDEAGPRITAVTPSKIINRTSTKLT